MKQLAGYKSIILLCGLGLSSSALANNAVNLAVGTTGLIVEVDSVLTESLHIRGSLHKFNFDENIEADDIDYSGEISSTNLGAILDYHPFQSFFRLSAGLFMTDLGIDLTAKPSQSELEIGDNTYLSGASGNPLELTAEVDFAPVSPYIGLGWGNSLGQGLGFSFDIGVLMVGEAEVDFHASGTATEQQSGLTIDVERNAEFQENMQKEQVEVEKDLEDLAVYPVIMMGISYTF